MADIPDTHLEQIKVIKEMYNSTISKNFDWVTKCELLNTFLEQIYHFALCVGWNTPLSLLCWRELKNIFDDSTDILSEYFEWNFVIHNSIEYIYDLQVDKTMFLSDEKPQHFLRQQVNIPKTYKLTIRKLSQVYWNIAMWQSYQNTISNPELVKIIRKIASVEPEPEPELDLELDRPTTPDQPPPWWIGPDPRKN